MKRKLRETKKGAKGFMANYKENRKGLRRI